MLFEDVEKTAGTRGMDVVLTIDKVIQHIAERALLKAVTEAEAKGGMAIVMNPDNGEILGHGQYAYIRRQPFLQVRPEAVEKQGADRYL